MVCGRDRGLRSCVSKVKPRHREEKPGELVKGRKIGGRRDEGELTRAPFSDPQRTSYAIRIVHYDSHERVLDALVHVDRNSGVRVNPVGRREGIPTKAPVFILLLMATKIFLNLLPCTKNHGT